MRQSGSSATLDFFITAKKDIAVVAFSGSFGKECLETLERCVKELESQPVKSIVLAFHDVREVESRAISSLVKFQKQIRDRKCGLRLCFLKDDLKKLLLNAGAIRIEEIQGTLLDAIQHLATVTHVNPSPGSSSSSRE